MTESLITPDQPALAVSLCYAIYIIQLALGIFLIDMWLYLKHSMLHWSRKVLYPFHQHHHTFKDPSAFAAFAIHPFETLWTFAPICLW